MGQSFRQLSSGANVALGTAIAFLVGCDDPLPPIGAIDGGTPAPQGGSDASMAGDGSAPSDAWGAACEVALRDILDAETGDTIEFDVAGGSGAFEVVYTEHDAALDPTRNAYFVRVPVGAAPLAAVAALAAGDEQLVGQPVVRPSGDGFVSVFSKTFDHAYDLAIARVDGSSSLVGNVVDATSTPTTADVHPALVENGASGYFLAYLVESLAMGSLVDAPMLATLDAQGGPSGTPKPILGMGDVRGMLRLHALGGGVKIAFRDSGSVLRLAALAPDGTLGAVRAISDPSTVAEDFDFAAGSTGGVAVFDVSPSPSQPSLRLRVLDSAGAPIGGERSLLGGSRRGAAPALASGPSGYVVAYRGSDDGTHWSLRLAFVDASSYAVVSDEAIAALASRAGRVRIGGESGGRLLVVWDDARVGAPGVRLRSAEIDCP